MGAGEQIDTEPTGEQIDTEPTGEQIDIVTATGVHLRAASRSEVHDGAHWHQVFHCLVIRPGSPARIVLQRRHHSKAAFPGLLDLSATGHLTAGESPDDGVRELNEELGINATADDLFPVGVRLLADDGGEGRNRELVHLYFMTDDRPLDRYAPEPTEVESLIEVAAADLLGLIANPDASAANGHEWRPGSAVTPTTITANDLIKPSDGYWTVLLVMAERYATGDDQIVAI